MIKYFIICLLILQQVQSHIHTTKQEIQETLHEKEILFGSTLRLQHINSNFHLHSHDVSYGTGSQQQSVTAFRNDNDYNSLWTVKYAQAGPYKTYQDPLICGDKIRLEHILTKKNLHSHKEQSPLSRKQEVSCYGADGDGDEGDDWIIECINVDHGLPVKGNSRFHLKHLLTGQFLRSSKQDNFNKSNCGRQCPIEGQLEISAVSQRGRDTEWAIVGGLIMEKKEVIVDDWERSSDEEQEECMPGMPDSDGFVEVKVKRKEL